MSMLKPMLKTLTTSLVGLAMLTGCGTQLGALGGAQRVSALEMEAQSKVRQQIGNMGLFVMPDNGPKPILDAINAAKKSIRFELYMMTYTDFSKQVADALIAKSKAGVDVKVILEAQPYIPVNPENPKPFNVNGPAMKALIEGGVRVARSSPRFVYTHEKAMVVDNQVAYIMTMNMTSSAFTKNREYVVVTKSPSDVKEVAAIFDADWNNEKIVPKDPDLVVSPDNSRKKILGLIDKAQSELVVQCEFINDPEIIEHLAAAQNKRKVKLSVMMSFQKPQKDGYDPNGVSTKLMHEAGITNFTFTKTVTLHAKCIIADGKAAYVGSENMTANSLDNNREMGIIVQDPGVVNKLSAVAAEDWRNNPPAPAAK